MAYRYYKRDNINLYLAYAPEANVYKIGITKKHPKERLKQIGYFQKIELIHYCFCKVGYEKFLHVKLKSKNVKIGTFKEYFDLSSSDVEFVINFMNAKDKERIFMLNNYRILAPESGI